MHLRFLSVLALVAACSGVGRTAEAKVLLPLEQDWMSDLFIGSVSGSYDSTTGAFGMTGTASALDLGAGTASDFASFIAPTSITGLEINAAGEVVTPGVFTVFLENSPPNLPPGFPVDPPPIGDVFPLGQNLLEGTITEVAFNGTDNIEMIIEITGGSAKEWFSFDVNDPDPEFIPPFPPLQTPISLPNSGLKLSIGGGITDFTADFAFTGSADLIGPIPEPATAVLWVGFAASALVAGRRTRFAD